MEKVKEGHCRHCGLPTTNKLSDHDIMDDGYACDDCCKQANDILKETEKKADRLFDQAQEQFKQVVIPKKRICDKCQGEGWIDNE